MAAASKFTELSFNASENAVLDPVFKKIIGDPKSKFDIVMTSVAPGNEIGYFFTHRFNSQLVIYCTAQVSLPQMDYALGMPHNPAYIPFALTGFNRKMNLFERVVNTAVTNLALIMRYAM